VKADKLETISLYQLFKKEKMKGRYMRAFVRERVEASTATLITDGLSRHARSIYSAM